MIRSSLEGMCARLATEHITEEQMEELEENVYLASFHASKGHMEQMAELDNRFHHILYASCDSKMLENPQENLVYQGKKHGIQRRTPPDYGGNQGKEAG